MGHARIFVRPYGPNSAWRLDARLNAREARRLSPCGSPRVHRDLWVIVLPDRPPHGHAGLDRRVRVWLAVKIRVLPRWLYGELICVHDGWLWPDGAQCL